MKLESVQNIQSASPLLSVGLPVYNGAKWIIDAIESILEQSFTDFELIIVDNASTDETEAICRDFAARDTRIKYHRNPDNIGLFKNFDRAFELSTGQYFKWAADSDFCLEHFFEKCIVILDTRPDVVLVYPQAYLLMLDPRGEEIISEYFDDFNLEDERPSERFIKYLNREKINNAMHGIIRSSALRKTSLIRPLPGSDISMVAELTLLGKFVEVPERLFVRRFDAQTSTLLMSKEIAKQRKTPLGASLAQKIDLHTYRFISTCKAPISIAEKWRICFYLMRRFTWLRHKILRKTLWLITLKRQAF
ncbi:glycosyltransferase family 2 protein [Paraglaciecola hydrolytica]|uniref:glycosyltransferase family 2 protein n=1 Tax=Paraglaciecola hydrolytica TaxID=1799789 RepID=UPI0012FEF06C|nr:glycosyltransferase family A protein [Paraglaciecola hydrolytica]